MPVKRKRSPWELRKETTKKGKQLGLSGGDRNIVLRGVLQGQGYKLNRKRKPKAKIADVEGKKGDKTATLTKRKK